MTPWTTACQASLSITNSKSLLKLISIELLMPSNHLILCCPLLFPPSIFSSIRVFSDESALCIRWQKYWSFSFSIIPSNEHSGLTSLRSPDLGSPSYLTQKDSFPHRETKVRGGWGGWGSPKVIQMVQGRARLGPGVPESQGVALYSCSVISPTPDHKR